MTLGAMQTEAKKHKWAVERLPPIKAGEESAKEACAIRTIQEKMIEITVLANEHEISLDRIAGFLERDMR